MHGGYFYRGGQTSGEVDAVLPQSGLNRWRDNARADAQKIVEQKSRSLKPWGELPAVVELRVSLFPGSLTRDDEERRSSRGNWLDSRREKQAVAIPIGDALKSGRRFLLLGDLGSGKSTLAAQFITNFIDESSQFLGFLIPANVFADSARLTVDECLVAASQYINQNVVPTLPTVELKKLLNDGTEIAVAVDGLDEIDAVGGTRLLRAFERIVSHWPNIKILVTARPAELRGVDFSSWRVITTVPLNDSEILDLFRLEALANGVTPEQAGDEASHSWERLKNSPQLVSLASTPLAVRLLYSRLAQATSDKEYTLGDLLVELARERLGGWNTKDGKDSVAPNFEREIPNEDARAQLLGVIALGALGSRRISIEAARYQLGVYLNTAGLPRSSRLVDEALIFYSRVGLISLGTSVEFPSQPMLEVVAGFSLAHAVSEGRTAFASAKQEQWRVVSFASTVLRRMGILERVVSDLGNYIRQLQKHAGGAVVASYIVDESGSGKLAQYYVEGLRELEPRPLTLLRDELQQSAQSIARTLKLAGSVGFEWLYSEYLDSRYPLVNAGSRTIQMIFEQWAYLIAGQLTPGERAKLTHMVAPLIACPTLGTHNFLEVLALLVPEAFEAVSRLWYVSGWLDHNLFSRWAVNDLKAAFIGGLQEQVNRILLARMREGYETSFACAHLWSELNPDTMPPRDVVKTAVRARAAYRYGSHHGKLMGLCQERLGDSVWLGLVRWYMLEGAERLAAGAALLLYENGERELELLGRTLLGALHDGGYIKDAEPVLAELVFQDVEMGGGWIGAAIAEADYHGAHSGWWRIFLKVLPQLGGSGKPLLRQAVAGVKDILLPRYPEVRQAFHDLLLGPVGHEYLSVLRECLDDFSPEIRLGAARILVTIDPSGEPKALETLIVSKPVHRFGNQWEWEEYCLNLPFSPSVLGFLKARLDSFVQESRVFALAILYRNDFALSADEKEQLVAGIVGSRWHYLYINETRRNVLAEPASVVSLEKMLFTGSGETPQVAAGLLLKFHAGSISPEVEARCNVLDLTNRSWLFDGLVRQAQRLHEDANYSELVHRVSQSLMEQGGNKPLLESLRSAVTEDAAAWKEIVWGLVCGVGGLSADSEDAGAWLLTHAKLFPDGEKTARRVGEVARSMIHDQRLLEPRHVERKQWLALLAHEFAGLPKEEIEAVLLAGNSIMGSAANGLIARLGYVSAGFGTRRPSFSERPTFMEQTEETGHEKEDERLLGEYALQADSMHPRTCSAIENVLYGSQINDGWLDGLARNGQVGTLIANAILFCRRGRPKIEYIARFLRFHEIDEGDKSAHCLERLRRIFRISVRTALRQDEEFKRQTVDALKQALGEQDKDVDRCSAAVSLYRLTGEFDVALMGTVIEAYASTRWGDLEDFIEILVEIPGLQLLEAERGRVAAALERSIRVLAGYSWRSNSGLEGPLLACLLYPVLYWTLMGTVSIESANVFWRGVVFSFSDQQSSRRVDTAQMLAAISPVLRLVPKPQLRAAIEMGRNHPDVHARTLSIMIQSFSG